MNEYQQEFIANLKKWRKTRGLSQEKLAELCEVATGTIGNIECGIAKPSFDLLVTMANVLGIHPSLLLSDQPLSSDIRSFVTEHTLLQEIYLRLEAHFQNTKDSPQTSSPASGFPDTTAEIKESL